MVDSFLKNIMKVSGNELVGQNLADVNKFYDTGSYTLNALLSADIYGGIAGNRITVLAGESGVGKSYFTISIVKEYLKNTPDGIVLYFDSESAIEQSLFINRGIPENDVKERIAIFPVGTVEELRTQLLNILYKYNETKKTERQPMMICVDSLGNLSTSKEISDSKAGKETLDMTKAKLIKGLFRILPNLIAKADIPMIITNHTYEEIGTLYAKKIMTGGSGLVYNSSTTIFLSRKKEKEGSIVVGNIIHAKNEKNRLARENLTVDIYLNYTKGVNRFYGLADLAIQAGVFKQAPNRIELPSGEKVFLKAIYREPNKYFTPEVLDKINEFVKVAFSYGNAELNSSTEVQDFDENDFDEESEE